MRNLYLAFNAVALVAAVSFIWLLIVAFRRRVLWGIFVLFLSPITATIFAIKYWREAKTPFLLYITTTIACFAYVGYILVHLGGIDTLGMAEEIRQGTLTQERALQWMEQTMNRMDSSGMLDQKEKEKLHEMQGLFQQMKEKAPDQEKGETSPSKPAEPKKPTAISEKKVEDKVAVAKPTPPVEIPVEKIEKEPTVQKVEKIDTSPASSSEEVAKKKPPEQLSPDDGTITVAEAGQYIGKRIKIVDKNSVEHEGTLVKSSPDRLVIEMWKYGGRFAIEMKTAEVRTLEVVR